jgi:hypothetical protein
MRAALQILEVTRSGRPGVLLSAVRWKRLSNDDRRFDFKFGLPSWGWRVLIRVDLYHAHHLGWLPIAAMSIWKSGTNGDIGLFEFNANLCPTQVDFYRTVVHQKLERELLTDPLPRGFTH